MTNQPPKIFDPGSSIALQAIANATRPYDNNPQKNFTRFQTWLAKAESMQQDTIAQEFQEIQKSLRDPGNSTDIWRKNGDFNRYADTICFDNNRVVLSDGLQPDYLHANYVDGYYRKNAYILTQGPLDNTACDFWRMIWQETVSTVVMITRLVERYRSRCSRYFPITNDRDFHSGAFRVALVASERRTNCTTSLFNVTNILNDEVRKIVHVWYSCWPDQRIPDDVSNFGTFVNFIKVINAQAVIELGNPVCHVRGPPIVVHCSAGTGRSALIAAMDIVHEAVLHKDFVDPLELVLKMRKQRYHAIHSKIQLLFVYDYTLFMCHKYYLPCALSNDFKMAKTRKPFSSKITSLETAMKDFWISMFNLNLITKSECLSLSTQNFVSALDPDHVESWTFAITEVWLSDKTNSFIAFESLLQLLEICFDPSWQHLNSCFEKFVESLHVTKPSSAVEFFKQALITLIDSDNLHNTDYLDLLLMNLATYDVKSGDDLLTYFISDIPYFAGYYLKLNGKRVQELLCYVYANQSIRFDVSTKCCEIEITPHFLSCLHFPPKKIIVSNAPPMKLKRRNLISKNKFECELSAGGLVSGVKSCLKKEDQWVSHLDSNILGFDKVPNQVVPELIKESVFIKPKFRRSTSVLRCTIGDRGGQKNDDDYKEYLHDKTENDFLSLQKKLDEFAKLNFVVNPLLILKDEHTAFYNGISNGLLWPAFHNLPQYIIDEYKGENGPEKLAVDWHHYVKVNYHFAIQAARSCRQQDFLWIHDYHLFLVGLIMRSLDPTLNCGFFLHIPFGLTEQFISDFPEQGKSILRSLLGFTRVGFQTNKDTLNFLKLLKIYFPDVVIRATSRNNCTGSQLFSVVYKSAVTDVGTFPISIKMDKFLKWANDENMLPLIDESRIKMMQKREGKLFLSIERFDYTKGIVERMAAIKRYFEKYPERAKVDVFYQVAVSSRGDISSYQLYQKTATGMADEINKSLTQQLQLDPRVKVVIIDQANHPQEEVAMMYRTADVIVVTPVADGMNLVVKEAIICNPDAVFVLSTGAGAENELFDNGFGDCYVRVENIADADTFADLLHDAVTTPEDEVVKRGKKLFTYTKCHDIDRWISSFVDHGWTKNVIKVREVHDVAEVRALVAEMREMRKLAVTYLLEDVHVGVPFDLSLQNLLSSLEISCRNFRRDSNSIALQNEITSVKEDLAFLDYIANGKSQPNLQDAFLPLLPSNQHKMLFAEECKKLRSFIEKVSAADLMIFRWENVLANPGSFDFSTMQSIAGGLLLSRFMNRFSTQAIIWTDIDFQSLREQMCSPNDVCILVTSSGTQIVAQNRKQFSISGNQPKFDSVLEEITRNFGIEIVKEKTKIAIFGGHTTDLQWISWAISRGANVCAAFLNPRRSIDFGSCRDIVVEYTFARSLLAAMASHVIKKVKTGI